ncbi:hypothetical protein U91I_03509 [alpha proteobacterium U9-1i]|nr:hypothetical protein U91I_03509 [alpha proteobacterium U9-1i]
MEFDVRVQMTALTMGVCFIVAACSPPQQPTAEPTTEAPAAIQARGIVRALTPDYNAITIEHEDIPEIGMSAMTMEFTVTDASMLNGLEVGDQVSFQLSGPLDITSIAVAESN